MPVSLDQFAQALTAAELISADELKAYLASLPESERPADGDALAQRLIKQGKLTAFQAQLLLSGRGAALTVGEYVLVDRIGAGGMGQVFKARHKRMQRVVALKMMSPQAMKDEASVRRFQREVRAAARLEHQHIVTAYDAGQHGKTHYLVMQFVDGGDLANLVKAKGPLPIDRAVSFTLQTARGLAYAHAEGVVHRDIKPANLLVDKKGVVKILDMGLARVVEGNEELTGTEQVMGTVDYMSPEQASDSKNADARSDVYSLGCTLWFLLTGKRLYDGDSMISRLMKHRDAPLPSLLQAREDAPWSLEQALHKMIAKRVGERFQTMDEVVAALDLVHAEAGSGGMGSSVLADADLAQFLSGIGGASQLGGGSRIGGGSSGAIRPGSSGALRPAADPGSQGGSNSGSRSGLTAPLSAAVGDTHDATAVGPRSATKLGRVRPATAAKDKRNRTVLVAGGVTVSALVVGLVAWSLMKSSGDATAPATGSSIAATVPRGPPPPSLKAPFDAATAEASQQAWAAHLGIPVVSKNSIGMRFVLVPPGEYLMGSPPAVVAQALADARAANINDVEAELNSEKPQHRVVLSQPFLLGETEVTIGQFAKFADATGYKTKWEYDHASDPNHWRKPYADATDDLPLTYVDWNDAAAFCNWLSAQEKLPRAYENSTTLGWIPVSGPRGYRLPSEAQWEYACRAGTTTLFSFGDDPALLPEYAWVASNAKGRLQPVGTLKSNAFGLFDMHGNVYEWVLDVFASDWYARSPSNDPENVGTTWRGIYRGGHINQNVPAFVRSAFRRSTERQQHDHSGFRVSRLIDPANVSRLPAATAVAALPVSSAVAKPATPRPATTAAASGKPIDYAVERKAAEWALSKGGKVWIVSSGGGGEREVTNVAALPKEPFALRRLSVADKKGVTDVELAVLRTLAEVWDLEFSNCGITGGALPVLAGLTTVRNLGLNGSKTSDADLAALAGWKQLERLRLTGCRASEDGLERLSLGNLKALEIGGIVVGNRLTTVLGDRAPNLGELRIVDAALTNTAVPALVGLKNLSFLELNGGSIGDAGMRQLAAMASLTELWLRNLAVSDAGLKHLETMTGLKRLKLNGMKFSEEAIAALYKALPTTEVLIDDVGFYPKPFPVPPEAPGAAPPNTLSDAERAAGWKLLFDGRSLAGWQKYQTHEAPRGWWVVDGQLRGDGGGGFLSTVADYGPFELTFEFRATSDGNSGVNYCADDAASSPSSMCPEYELAAGTPTSGMMWDGGPPSGVVLNSFPPGWFRGQIIVTPGRARHVLSDPAGKVLFDTTYVRDSAEFQKTNKGRDPNFWRTDRGKITLQAMTGSVAFRNVKIREMQ